MKSKLYFSVVLVSLLIVAAGGKKHAFLKSDALADFVEIEQGSMTIDSIQMQVDGFYISRYEVSNHKYSEFLQSLKESGNSEALAAVRIGNEKWEEMNIDWNIEEQYHTYPGFAEFPVVNISYEGAQLYCQWLTEKVNREIRSDYAVEFRLPKRNEWIRAARGDTRNIYAWHHPYLRNKDGNLLCNFKRLGAERIHFNEQKKVYEIVDPYHGPAVFITSRVDEYAPNESGIYNMCGNVSEMIARKGTAVGGNFNSPGYDVRVESEQMYNGASPFVGFRPVMIIRHK